MSDTKPVEKVTKPAEKPTKVAKPAKVSVSSGPSEKEVAAAKLRSAALINQIKLDAGGTSLDKLDVLLKDLMALSAKYGIC